jgi:pimeloyl-ACP methyl ester carboxylesterase
VARKFLYLIVGIVVFLLAGAFTYNMFGLQLIRTAMVPTTAFRTLPPPQRSIYADAAMWVARPDIPQNPSLWLPDGASAPEKPGDAAIFYIHPTTFLDRTAWNASLDNAETNNRTTLFTKGQASAFNAAGQIWAPKYRQATFGAFLTDKPERQQAFDVAYMDVAAAFDEFVKEAGPKRPIILVGHSQGALHLTRLIVEKIAKGSIAKRIVATYIVGWPLSVTNDLPGLGFPACDNPDQTGCIMSWQSFAEPADYQMITDVYDQSTGFDGQSRKGSTILCSNPITGGVGGAVEATANAGTLINSADLTQGEVKPGIAAAKCDARGFLLIGPPPEGMKSYVLPGNNYHVFDFSLFWANIRSDALRRLAAFEKPPLKAATTTASKSAAR